MARQIALTTTCIRHDRGINVGVSDCHQNTSASDEPLNVAALRADRRTRANVRDGSELRCGRELVVLTHHPGLAQAFMQVFRVRHPPENTALHLH